jgi:hypothetical protein
MALASRLFLSPVGYFVAFSIKEKKFMEIDKVRKAQNSRVSLRADIGT